MRTQDPVDDTLAITNQAMLFVMVLGALLLKFKQGFSATGIYEEGYDATLIEALLIGSVTAVAIGAITAAGCSTFQVLASRNHQAETAAWKEQEEQQQDEEQQQEEQDLPAGHENNSDREPSKSTDITAGRKIVV